MNRVLRIAIGITIFILLFGCSYLELFETNKNSNSETNTTQDTEIKQGEIIYKGKLAMPIENFITITSKFGYREAHGVVHSNHTGIDMCGSAGSRIMAVQDGEVTHAGWQNGYGNCVEIKHTDEQGNVFYSFYGHMRDNSISVEKGQNVVTGQIVGTQGSTGNSTGEHLHFEIRTDSGSNKYAIDPAPYLFTEKEG